MTTNFKNIHIGKLIKFRMQELDISLERAAIFLNMEEEEIKQVYTQESLDGEAMLRWSKLLEYDFFRIYTQHLILYAPQKANKPKRKATGLPVFKKNIYSQEVIDYLLNLVESGKKNYAEVQKKYNIPNTTIMRWAHKYGDNKEQNSKIVNQKN